jgi:cell division protein FtsQ
MNATLDPPSAPEQSPIDPRFEERRLAVARQAGRRRLKWLIIGLAVILLLIGAALLVRAPFLSVEDVEVSGAVYADPAAIAAITDSLEGEPMLLLDEGDVERRLEAIPWIRRAEVDREWPSRIRVELAERTPLAVYGGTDGAWHVVDTEGVVLATLAGRPVDVFLITGEWPPLAPGQAVPPNLADAVRVARGLPPTLASRTLELAVDANGNVELHLQPKGKVVLGTADQLRDKLIAAVTMLSRVDPNTLVTLDVRAPATPVVDPALTGGPP